VLQRRPACAGRFFSRGHARRHSRVAHASLNTLNATRQETTMPTRYYLTLPDGTAARGSDPAVSFTAHGADEFAAQLQEAMRTAQVFERWRRTQEEPDEVDPGLGATDPSAVATGGQRDLQIDLVLTTSLPGDVVRHRLRLLAGSGWQLRDVTAV
jgi:hypothetical protein